MLSPRVCVGFTIFHTLLFLEMYRVIYDLLFYTVQATFLDIQSEFFYDENYREEETVICHICFPNHTSPCLHNTASTMFDRWSCMLWIKSPSFPSAFFFLLSFILAFVCPIKLIWAGFLAKSNVAFLFFSIVQYNVAQRKVIDKKGERERERYLY